MAITSYLTFDLHHEEPPKATTYTFSVNNRRYEIDLCEQHFELFQGVLSELVKVARRNPTRSLSAGRIGNKNLPAATPLVSAIREWARQNGMDVSAKGRIPKSLMYAYEASGSNVADSADNRGERGEKGNSSNTVRRVKAVKANVAASQQKRVVNGKGEASGSAPANTRGRLRVT